jgi:sugar phosphate isomerase/epimerase
MKAFWAKITAFFMAIIAFFTGLFSGGGKSDPQPEPTQPTTVIEQPTEPATEPATEPDPGVGAYLPRIVTTTDVFERGYPAEQALERLAGLGYEGIDMGFDYFVFSGSPFLGDDCLTWATGLRERADALGVPYTHAHAPGDAAMVDYVNRSIRASQVIGAKYCVVHPITSQNGSTIADTETFLSLNIEAIRQYLPLAEQCGVILLSENIPWSPSADPRVIAELVRQVDSPWFGWCFDTGHAYAKGYEPQILTECCVVPLSVHIQDSNGGDDHLIPGDGRIDWDAFVRTLKTVGYSGDCVLEAHHQSLNAADSERDAILTRLLEKGKELQSAMRE